MNYENLYAVLGVTKSSTPGDIKAKWRELSRKMHPDRNGSTPEANDAFAKITMAYAVISDPAMRRTYDKGKELLTDLCPKCHGSGQHRTQQGFTRVLLTPCPRCEGLGRVSRSSPVQKG